MKNKGFTLVELLAVIVILAIILAIAVPRISSLIENSRSEAYRANEKMLGKAAHTYLAAHNDLIPAEIDGVAKIDINSLKNDNFINDILDVIDKTTQCSGYVIVKRTNISSHSVTPYLKCGENYMTDNYVAQDLTSVEVLVVAGGGSGGSHTGSTSTGGGGGGAGGLIFNSSYTVSPGQNISLSVGSGGTGTISGGNVGQNSTFGTITVTGGGRGTGLNNTTSANGGSGGGDSYYATQAGTKFGLGVAGQGNNGGSSTTHPSPYPAAGGGGAGTVGGDATATISGGGGGEGLYYGDKFSNSYGASGWFAGGGGGGIGKGGLIANRGLGKSGGGDGGYNVTNGTNALANTGAGGGGSAMANTSGGHGCSGIILIRYPGVQKASGGIVTIV